MRELVRLSKVTVPFSVKCSLTVTASSEELANFKDIFLVTKLAPLGKASGFPTRTILFSSAYSKALTLKMDPMASLIGVSWKITDTRPSTPSGAAILKSPAVPMSRKALPRAAP
ncbi:MAG: hypothetical protein ACD_73C00072G0001 [uncultured bacterium]|nr:MAG: hypothetical protein ACD_73C00072G0001 [uncultured bacterium]